MCRKYLEKMISSKLPFNITLTKNDGFWRLKGESLIKVFKFKTLKDAENWFKDM